MASRPTEYATYSPLMQTTIVDEHLPVRRVYADGTIGPVLFGSTPLTAHARSTLGHLTVMVPESGVYRVVARRPGKGSVDERQVEVDFRLCKAEGLAADHLRQMEFDGLLALLQQVRDERDFLRAELAARRGGEN